ncbi:MAG: 5-oxoprolinase subunit PxpB [Pseudomonadota bacterium]
MTFGTITTLAEDLVEISVSDAAAAQRVAERLRPHSDIEEVVPALSSVAVMFAPSAQSPDSIKDIIARLISTGGEAAPRSVQEITLPVTYGGKAGPDLEAVAETLGLSTADVIKTHTDQWLNVDMMGFTPGFAYLSGLPWSVPRLATPRQSVAAGSVGVAGHRSGIYSLGGPGGWPVIGRTSLALFDASLDPPFLLAPGSRVRFQAVNP